MFSYFLIKLKWFQWGFIDMKLWLKDKNILPKHRVTWVVGAEDEVNVTESLSNRTSQWMRSDRPVKPAACSAVLSKCPLQSSYEMKVVKKLHTYKTSWVKKAVFSAAKKQNQGVVSFSNNNEKANTQASVLFSFWLMSLKSSRFKSYFIPWEKPALLFCDNDRQKAKNAVDMM